MYKNLTVFLKNITSVEKIAEYDFKNEAPCAEIREQNDPINKFLKYKTYNKNEHLFDCDSSNGTCSLTNDIYLKLWGCSYENRYKLSDKLKSSLGDIWPRFSADTMNSYQTTYTKAKELFGKASLRKNKLLVEFATYTHTIGNFTLIPFSFLPNTPFNPYRYAEFKDYFDLSLKFIQENVDAETFKKYIDTFFLNDYVDSNYNVLPLFERHKELLSQDKMSITDLEALLPKTPEEMNEYLQNVITKIKSRGKRMAKELLRKTDSCTELSKAPEIKKPTKLLSVLKKLCFFIGVFIVMFLVVYLLFFIKACNSAGGFTLLVSKQGFFPIMAEGLYLFAAASLKLSALFTIIFWLICYGIRKVFATIAKHYLAQCKHCKKLFVLKKVSSTLVKEDDISILDELKDKDASGNVYGTHEVYIPGVRKHYDIKYVCKHCGRCTVKHTTKDVKKI